MPLKQLALFGALGVHEHSAGFGKGTPIHTCSDPQARKISATGLGPGAAWL